MTISPSKYKYKYRISSSRLLEWDYGSPGYYFITICTINRIPWFGEVNHDRIKLSAIGDIATQHLELIPSIHPLIRLETWVVMPNHIHAIIVIGVNTVETLRRGVSTTKAWKPETLGAIINQFKSICTKRIRAMGYTDFSWQAQFYDHIIQKENELDNNYAYIQENPIKWTEDEYFS